jgi:hypothetical protein
MYNVVKSLEKFFFSFHYVGPVTRLQGIIDALTHFNENICIGRVGSNVVVFARVVCNVVQFIFKFVLVAPREILTVCPSLRTDGPYLFLSIKCGIKAVGQGGATSSGPNFFPASH